MQLRCSSGAKDDSPLALGGEQFQMIPEQNIHEQKNWGKGRGHPDMKTRKCVDEIQHVQSDVLRALGPIGHAESFNLKAAA